MAWQYLSRCENRSPLAVTSNRADTDAIDAQVAAALLTAIAGLIVALATGAMSYRQRKDEDEWRKNAAESEHAFQERLAQLESQLREREARAEREADAEKVLTRYREPLAAASYDLQRRLYNIIALSFLGVYMKPGNEREDEAVESTLYRVAQYLGWTEILRRDIQFLKFREADETRAVAQLQADIGHTFASDGYGHDFMLWQDDQRAIGELMVVRENGSLQCLGYASFIKRRSAEPWHWLKRLERDFRSGKAPGNQRLREIQHRLCLLVELLDKDQLLYSHAKLQRAPKPKRKTRSAPKGSTQTGGRS